MTLWLDSGTIRMYLLTETDVKIVEKLIEGRPHVEATIPEGVAFSVDVDGFKSEFSGNDPDVKISEVLGTLEATEITSDWVGETDQMCFRPNEECVITFSTDSDAIGSAFSPE